MAKAKSTKSAATIQVDFTDVPEGGGRTRVPEGDYKVRVKAVKPERSKSDNSMLVWTFEGVEGKLKGKSITDYTPLTAKALWKLRNLLNAMGIKVPPKKIGLDPKKLVNRELGITLVDDEYEGRTSSKVADYLDLDALTGDDVDDEEDEETEDTDDDEESDDDDDEKDSDDDDAEDNLEELDLDEF